MHYRKFFLILLLLLDLKAGSMPLSFKSGNELCYLIGIEIEGKTNLNKFYLSYKNRGIEDYLHSLQNAEARDSVVKFSIPVNEIDSKNENLLNDFRTLLKANKFPRVFVEIDRTVFLSFAGNKKNGKFELKLTLAGVKNKVPVRYNISQEADGSKILKGVAEVHLSEFSLVPPKKLLGLIRVQDVIFVTFDIRI